jgi:hypothetical protein
MINKHSESEIGTPETFYSATEAAISNPPTNFIGKLQQKWGVDNAFQVVMILLTFTLTGISAVAVRKFLFSALGYTSETSGWLKTITYIAFVFPTYQILILVYGTLLGQFNFFWEKEKKLGRAILKLFRRK